LDTTHQKIITAIRIKNEERWLQKVFDSLKGISSEIIILDGASIDKSLEICEKCKEVVQIIHQEDLTLDEKRDKNQLLEAAKKRNPDFIFSLDGDQVISTETKHLFLKEIRNNPEINVFQHQELFIWNKFDLVRYDGIYQNLWHNHLVRIKNQPDFLKYGGNEHPGNLHLGYVPQNAIGYDNPFKSRVKILHYGHFDNAIRKKKFDFYTTIDPTNTRFDGYKIMLPQKSKLSGPRGIELKKLSEVIKIIKKEEKIVSDITRIYQRTLLRDPDPQGLDYFKNEIQSGHLTFDKITKIIEQSEEYKKLQSNKK